jgi:hypothetical protein
VTEEQQIQAIADGALGVANDLSLAGQHVSAAKVAALIQLARVLWTRLQETPAAPAPEAPKLEAV